MLTIIFSNYQQCPLPLKAVSCHTVQILHAIRKQPTTLYAQEKHYRAAQYSSSSTLQEKQIIVILLHEVIIITDKPCHDTHCRAISSRQFGGNQLHLHNRNTIYLYHCVAILILLHSNSVTKLRLDEILVWCHVCTLNGSILLLETRNISKMVTA